ncbi:thioesterase II family protein [Streptomyces sp. NPDC094038]|uniref:thioesterase II family protein n=1 Tax=Streptomyces sp. NPDC094038 TaxID=3366055 RepID=UPI0038261025
MQIKDEESTDWIRRYRPSPDSDVRLVCFPHAGGSATFFHPVAMSLAPEADVVVLQYPGRQDRLREPCITDIGILADRLAEQIMALSEKPTVLFGHSMGATLAFETAVRLEATGVNSPHALVASGRRAPSVHRDEHVRERDDDGIIAELRALNGTDSAVFGDEELLRLALPAIRGDYTAIETYTCPADRRLRCGITVLTGDSDPRVTLEELGAWETHTLGPFGTRVFGGGHFFLADHREAVDDLLVGHLHRARGLTGRIAGHAAG